VFTSVLCRVNKEVKENNNNNKKPNPILAFYIQTRGAQTTIYRGKNTQNYEPNEFDRMRVKKFLSELLLLFSFTSLLTPDRTLIKTHKINKCAKLGSILLGVSREDDENIISHRVSIKF
jgi:hypothetical protein